jgi:aldehyde dehydrogenase (NAD+)
LGKNLLIFSSKPVKVTNVTMKDIADDQRKFFNTNTTKNVDFRIHQLKKFYRVLKENESLLHEAIYADFKKSAFDNYTTELGLLYHDIHEAIKKVKRWSKTKRVKTNWINFPAKSYILAEPLGVSLIIGAWNYPYQLSLAPVVAALAAGNTVVLKPSELPGNTSQAMARIISENFDPNYFTVVEGGIPETTALLEQKFDKIFFTGSVPVGKIIYKAAARHLTPVTLELGGKSPAFITENCDLEVSVKRLIWAKFLNAGQTCIAPDYVFVHQTVKDTFLEIAKLEIEKSHLSFDNGNYVQIIDEKNIRRLLDMMDQRKVFCGGGYDLSSRYIEPTLLNDITFEDEVMQEEIFGPVLPVIAYEDVNDAIHLVKSRPRPLSCYVFTKDKKLKKKILTEISFGGGAVNDALMHITNSHLPFGGVGESGIGAYHGEQGFKAFTHYKSVLEKPTWFEPDIKYYPHTEKKLKWVKRLLG